MGEFDGNDRNMMLNASAIAKQTGIDSDEFCVKIAKPRRTAWRPVKIENFVRGMNRNNDAELHASEKGLCDTCRAFASILKQH